MNTEGLVELYKSTYSAISDLEKQIATTTKTLNRNLTLISLAIENLAIQSMASDAFTVVAPVEESVEEYWRDVMTTASNDDPPSEFVMLCRKEPQDECAEAGAEADEKKEDLGDDGLGRSPYQAIQ
jgi:hypothetical protein